jgi:hypothetical protein
MVRYSLSTYIHGDYLIIGDVQMQEVLRSPLAKRLDLELERGLVYATAEMKATATGNFCHWFVSGLADNGLPTMLLDLAVPLSSTNPKDMIVEAKAFAETFVFPMAEALLSTPGAGESIPPLGVAERASLFESHMEHHFARGEVSSLTLQKQTESLFKMATFLEVVTPVKLIAQFQQVGVGTVESRIQRGRASGAIPKASEVRAKKEILKKGK